MIHGILLIAAMAGGPVIQGRLYAEEGDELTYRVSGDCASVMWLAPPGSVLIEDGAAVKYIAPIRGRLRRVTFTALVVDSEGDVATRRRTVTIFREPTRAQRRRWNRQMQTRIEPAGAAPVLVGARPRLLRRPIVRRELRTINLQASACGS